MAGLTETQKTILHALNGRKGEHYDLAREVESRGLFAYGDQDDMELSYICLSDPYKAVDLWAVVVGEIRGDSEAKIEVTVSLD